MVEDNDSLQKDLIFLSLFFKWFFAIYACFLKRIKKLRVIMTIERM